MICQDHREIYLIFATYNWKYIQYITTGVDPGKETSFLTMHEYGPFLPEATGNMERLGSVILALTQQLEEQANKGQPCRW